MKNSRIEKLGEVSDFIGGSQPPKSKFVYDLTEVVESEYIRLIQIRDYKSDNHVVYIPKSSTKKFCNKNDVMIGRYGPPVFQILKGLEGAYNVALMKAVPKTEDLDKDYLFRFLESPEVQNYIIKLSERAAGQTGVNKQALNDYPILIPEILEQKRIVAILDKAFADIDRARALTEQNLKNARELFESYLQKVFSQHGEGWVEKGLKDVALDFGRGKSKHRPRNDDSLYDGDFPFIQTGDVRNCEHVITSYSKTYNDKGLAQSKLWPKGTICITIAANIAETGILDFDGCFPDSIIGVVVNPEITTIRYVEYLLQSFKTILKAKGQGSAQDNINMGTFEKMVFPFPSVDEQNAIVDSLDGLMKSVQELERIYSNKLATIDELKKSILQKAFSGELTAKDAA